MPKYRVLEKSYIGTKVVEPGDEIDYDGLPAENLEPLDDEGRAKYQEYLASNAARVGKMVEQFKDPAAGGIADPAAFFKALQEQTHEEMAAMVAKGIADALATAFPNGMHKPAVAPETPLT